MTDYDSLKGDILASVDAVYAQGETDGAAAQKATDQAALDQANAATTAVQAEFDAYKASHPDTPPPPPPPPPPDPVDLSVPAGYKAFYAVDWRKGDDGKWPFYAGSASNQSAKYVKTHLAYTAEGQVLTASDSGGVLSSTRVLNSTIKCPQHFIARAYIKLDNFGPGAWPSFWARGDNGLGEIDLIEGFGGHIGGTRPVFKSTVILTGTAPTYILGQASTPLDTAIPKAAWNDLHCYQIEKTANKVTWSLDGKVVGSLTQAQLDTAAKGKTTWAAQMEGSGTWHWRADLQAGATSSNDSAGTWPSGTVRKQTNVAFAIYVPA